MKKTIWFLDAFLVGGFITGFFYGFLNPLYVSVILARLDGRVIALGTFMSSAFPVLIGAALGNKRVFQRLYRYLPVLMLAELSAAIASAIVAVVDLRAYYLASMFTLGVFGSSIVYLLQKIKEERYRGSRAAFDRRCDMADAIGLVSGSAVSIAGFSVLSTPLAVAILGAAQTLIIYGLFLLLYRSTQRRGGRVQEPPPRIAAVQCAFPAAAA
jgi:hypothetical protein